MYAKIENGVCTKCPYTIDDLRRDNPNTSFPAQMSDAGLQEFGVVSVVMTPAPSFDEISQSLSQPLPVLVGGEWRQQWAVANLPQSEIDINLNKLAFSVRATRNGLLKDSDWTQLADFAGTNRPAWVQYRQALRDVPQQAGFPRTVVWPTQPT